jgi:hypothetical protein
MDIAVGIDIAGVGGLVVAGELAEVAFLEVIVLLLERRKAGWR